MPVPTTFADLSTTAASNSPAGSENVFPSLDDYIRFINAALASIKDNTATNGWVSPYIAGTGSWAIPGTIGSTTPNTGAFTTLSSSGLTTANSLAVTNDSTFSGALRVIGASALGYGAGAGGTVTQATNKATPVTLNKPTGQITMNAAALAAGATVTFQVNNSLITTADTVLLTCPFMTVGPNNYRVEVSFSSNGSFNIRVTNISAGSLFEALVINFALIKGATA